MPDARIKARKVQYLPLVSPASMGEALETAMGFGYRGKVEVFPDDQGNHYWAVELNGPGNPLPVTAEMGHVLIWDGASFESMTSSSFGEKFDVG